MKNVTQRIKSTENGITLIIIISFFGRIIGDVFPTSFSNDPEFGQLSQMLLKGSMIINYIGIGLLLGFFLEIKKRGSFIIGIMHFFGSLANMIGIYLITAIFAEDLIIEQKKMVIFFIIGSGIFLFIIQRKYIDFRIRINEE